MQITWSRSLPSTPVGISLARESNTLLVWDTDHHLARLDRLGNVELHLRAPASLHAAVISEDGRSVAAIGKRGQVWLLTPDFVTVFERSIPACPIALAMEALGRRIAIADDAGGLHILDRSGQILWRASVARPLLHLAFVPESPTLVGSAEYGLVYAFDRDGKGLWRDGLVAHVGGMAVAGDGARILLACFTEGLMGYSVTQSQRRQLARAAPSRLVALDYRGEVLVTTGLANELALRGAEGEIKEVLMLPANATAITLDALGTSVVVMLANGEIARVELASASSSG